jgi:ATP-binding cassette subfamily C protein
MDFSNMNFRSGKPIPCKATDPIFLCDQEKVWLVRKGNPNIFVMDTTDKNFQEKRVFVEEAASTKYYLGGSLSRNNRKYTRVIVGNSEDQVLEVTKEEFMDLCSKGLKETNGVDSLFLDEMNKCTDLYLRRIKDDEREIRSRSTLNRVMMDEALNKLVAINQDGQQPTHKLPSNHPLYNVCYMVCQAKNIAIAGFSEFDFPLSQDNALDEIARKSRFRMRRIKLEEKWWTNDQGSFIAFLGQEQEGVALIPETPRSYILKRGDGREERVSKAIANELTSYGFIFYRPFPERKLTLKDLLSFGVEGCWKKDLKVIFMMSLLAALVGLAAPIITGLIFDSVIPSGNHLQLVEIGAFLLASTLSASIFEMTKSFAMLRVEGKVDFALQAAVWDRLLSLPVDFFRPFNSGDLASRSLAISEIRRILSGLIITSIIACVFSVFNLVLLFYYSFELALLAMMMIGLVLFLTYVLGRKQMVYEGDLVSLNNLNEGVVFQLISGIQKFKVAGAEERAFFRWIKGYEASRRVNYKKEELANMSTTLNNFMEMVLLIVVFWGMGRGMTSGLGAGKFIAFNTALMIFMKSLMYMIDACLKANVVKALFDKSRPIIETLPEYDDSKKDVGELAGGIEVSHLFFKYDKKSDYILNDVNLKIEPGEYVALVGPSGSGKSTLFRNLIGFERPDQGRIFYDTCDIGKYNIRSIRRQLGVVLQNGQLMAGDLFMNIVGSNPALTLDDAWEAARMAGLEEDIKDMPMTMNTVISEGATTLSGGQRQRLMIARAIVNKPKVLFFDEATSALDNKTQKIVSDSLDKLEATRIVIAHRLSTVKNCDRIIVMERGKVVEEGSFEALMANKSLFYQLAIRQMA